MLWYRLKRWLIIDLFLFKYEKVLVKLLLLSPKGHILIEFCDISLDSVKQIFILFTYLLPPSFLFQLENMNKTFNRCQALF